MADQAIEVMQSGICQMTSTIIGSAGRCVVVDAGYFPREMAQIEAQARVHGTLKALVMTHGHWDHILGHLHLRDVPVWASEVLVQEVTGNGPAARRHLIEAREFEAKWYVPRPAAVAWPQTMVALADGERRRMGELTLEALHVPGHSPDCLALLVEEAGVLIAGDYLSPREIPIVDDFATYYRTLHRFADLIQTGAAREVIPGHGWRMCAEEAKQVVRDDLAYLYQLMFFRDAGDAQAARHMMLPRLDEDPIMRGLHLENCTRLGLDEHQK